jgi:hypothetical protein
MTTTGTIGAAGVVEALASLAALSAAVVAVLSACWSSVEDEVFLDAVRSVEADRRRLESFDTKVVSEVDARGLPGRYVARSAADLLGGMLRLSPAEARRRVRQARALTPRVTLTGERLAPLRPHTAAARAAGTIGSDQVRVILSTLDPDGTLTEEADQRRRRGPHRLDRAQLPRRAPALRRHQADRQHPPNPRVDRPRQRLRVPRLRHPTHLARPNPDTPNQPPAMN